MQDELSQKDKAINALRKEHADYKTETEVSFTE